jgi:hypothetical protein
LCSLDVAADRYSGYSIDNIWKKIEEKDGKKKKIALEYVDIYASKIVKKPKFLALPKDTVLAIAKSDTLNIKEVCLFLLLLLHFTRSLSLSLSFFLLLFLFLLLLLTLRLFWFLDRFV